MRVAIGSLARVTSCGTRVQQRRACVHVGPGGSSGRRQIWVRLEAPVIRIETRFRASELAGVGRMSEVPETASLVFQWWVLIIHLCHMKMDK